jgi:hypothetical protein
MTFKPDILKKSKRESNIIHVTIIIHDQPCKSSLSTHHYIMWQKRSILGKHTSHQKKAFATNFFDIGV